MSEKREISDERKKVLAMTDEQFREFMMGQLQLGAEQFQELHSALATNTELTIANIASTKDLVDIFNGAKVSASRFVWLSEKFRAFIKFMYPFVLFGGSLAAILHGKWPKWGD